MSIRFGPVRASTAAAPDGAATAGGAAVPADPSTAGWILADDFVCNKQNVDKSFRELRKKICN